MGPDAPHFHDHRQRLRDKFRKTGFAGFAEYAVVELLLTLTIPRVDVKERAKALLARFGNLRGILDATVEELEQVKGIGSVTPVGLRIIRDAASLYLQQSADCVTALPTQRLCPDSGRPGSALRHTKFFRSATWIPAIA